MIGVILVGHAQLPRELLNVAVHVVGPQDHVDVVCIDPDDDVEEKHKELARKIEEVRTPKGVILITDMFGGTPSNLAISFMKHGEIEILAGVNVPMLIKLLRMRMGLPMKDALQEAIRAGIKYVNLASELLKK